MNNVFERIAEIVERLFEVEKVLITRESLFEDLGIDSLSKIQLYSEVEYMFRIQIEDEVLEEHYTIGDLVRCVENHY